MGETNISSKGMSYAVDLPITYREGSMLAIAYRVRPDIAAAQLAGLPLEPLVILGKTPVLFCLFDYRDTTIGPYREVGIGVFARRRGTRPSAFRIMRDMRSVEDMGMYITNLPVNTEAACSAGVEIWGFPKYVARIDADFNASGARIELGNELAITHSNGPGMSLKGLPFITYSFLDGELIRTIVEVDHRVKFGGASSLKVELIGSGLTSDAAVDLGLVGKKPSAVLRTDNLRAVLPKGKVL